MRSTLIILCAALSGCASFTLGTYVPTAAQSQPEIEGSLAFCKQFAYDAAHTIGEDAKRLALKATVVGIPLGVARERAVQRAAWAECMEARSFYVEAPK